MRKIFRQLSKAAWSLFFACAGAAAAPSDIAGRAVYVDDGDTFVLLLQDKTQIKVRMASIDAPESSHTNKEKGRVGQPFSDKSTQLLASFIKGQDVSAKCFEKDRFDRDVCEIFIGGESVNRKMVASGMAWANQSSKGRYLRDKSLVGLEAKARSDGLGLWQGKAPIPPWEWRKTCWVDGQCAGGL